jgi:threonine dehydrogenase-like Zn-dependent dehydrogenase
MGTGWFAADAANGKPGKTVAVVGDGAVGLLGVISAKQMGAGRIIVMSRHETRQTLAREFGATDVLPERGDDALTRIKRLTDGVGADSVLDRVGTQESMMQAIRSTRQGGFIGYVSVPHGVALEGDKLFFAHVHLHGGPAPVRRHLPTLIDLVWNRNIDPGKVFDLALPFDDALVREQGEEMERALWAAVRALEEGAALSRRLAASEGMRDLRERFRREGADSDAERRPHPADHPTRRHAIARRRHESQ